MITDVLHNSQGNRLRLISCSLAYIYVYYKIQSFFPELEEKRVFMVLLRLTCMNALKTQTS